MTPQERARLIEKIDAFSTSPEKVEDLLWMSRYKISSDLRRVDVLEKALRWYQDEAVSLERTLISLDVNAMQASLHVLSLDGGKRAKLALGDA